MLRQSFQREERLHWSCLCCFLDQRWLKAQCLYNPIQWIHITKSFRSVTLNTYFIARVSGQFIYLILPIWCQETAMVMESNHLVHLHCIERLALQKGKVEVLPFYPTVSQIPPKANYKEDSSLLSVWDPKGSWDFSNKINQFRVDFVFLSLSSFLLDSTTAEVFQERPGQQKDRACGRGLSLKKRLSHTVFRRAVERGKGN